MGRPTIAFTQSGGRAFEESPGKARNCVDPFRKLTTGPCDQVLWKVKACGLVRIGGFYPFDWVRQASYPESDPPNYAPGPLYRTWTYRNHFVDSTDGGITPRERYWEECVQIHPTLCDIYKYTATGDQGDGIVHSWERGDDGSITESIAASVTPASEPVSGIEQNFWTQTINTATKKRWQSICPKTGDDYFDFIVEHTWWEIELTDAIADPLAQILVSAQNLSEDLDLEGTITRYTTWGNDKQPGDPESYDLDAGITGNQETRYYIRSQSRTPGGLAWVDSSIPPTLFGGDPIMDDATPELKGGVQLGASAITWGEASTLYWGIRVDGMLPTEFNADAFIYGHTGLWADVGKFRVAVHDLRGCLAQVMHGFAYEPQQPLQPPMTGWPSYQFPETSIIPYTVRCADTTLTEKVYALLPPCRDQDPECISFIDVDYNDLDEDVALPAHVEAVFDLCQCYGVSGCPGEGLP